MLLVSLYIICIISAAAGIYGLLNLKHIRESFKWISVYLLVSGIFQYLGYIFSKIYYSNKLWYNLIILIYFILIYLVFYHFTKSKTIQRFNHFLFIIGGFVILILDVRAIHMDVLSIDAITMSSLVYSIASMVYLLDMLRTPGVQLPFKTGKVYALAGILLYNSAIIFFWAAKKVTLQMNNESIQGFMYSLEIINQVMLVVFYVILFLSLRIEKFDDIKDEF